MVNKDKRIYELKLINNKELVNIGVHLHSMLSALWEDPKIVVSILMNSNPKDILHSLLPLFANNFYENILSQKFVQNNLLYLITLLLKHEITTYCNLLYPKNFLNINSTCGYLLYELRNKRDFQIFIKEIIEEVVEIIDENPYNICFNIDKIECKIRREFSVIKKDNKINKKEKLKEDSGFNDLTIERIDIYLKHSEEIDEIKKRYFSEDIKNDFNEINPKIKEYYSKTFDFSKENEYQFFINSIKYFSNLISKRKDKNIIYSYYLYDFYLVTKFIEKFLNNLLDKINIIPYSVRVIAKIISILITKKYKNISIIKRNTFICRFFFCALFWPTSENSNDSWSIANFSISRQSINNILYIENIFNEFIMGELYKEKKNYEFFPFNKFFIEKMDLLIKFIEELIDVDLPEFIIKSIEDDNYIFDYIKENENDGIINRSICFKIDDIYDMIICTMKKNENIFLKNNKLKIRYQALTTNANFGILNKLDKKAKIENKLYYYLISDCIFTEGYEKRIKIKKKMNYFTLECNNNPKNKEDENKNLINEAKNILSGLLFHLITLTKENISKNCQKDINKLLKEISILSKSSHYSFNDDIKTSWYAEPLIKILPKLPVEISNNNCQLLIEELINDVNNSIKDLYKFNGALDIINDEKINYTKTTISFLEKNIELITGINSYTKVIDIINNKIINVGFYITNNDNKLIFYLNKTYSSKLSKIFDYNKYYMHFKPQLFETIYEFIKEFPDFNYYFNDSNIKDKLELQKEMDIPKQLNNYINIIYEYLNEDYKNIEDESSDDTEKIYNDITSKLHEKLFPNKLIEKNKINIKQKKVDISNALKQFIEEVNQNMNKSYKYSINELNDIKEKIYTYIMESLYDKLYPKTITIEEKNNYDKTCLYSWLEPKHLIKKYINKSINQSFIPDAIKYFKLFIKEKSPKKKIDNINHLFDIIQKGIEFNEGKGEIGADDIIPILSYCYIKAQPYGINSSVKYSLLYNPYSKKGEVAMKLTQLNSIYEFVNELSFGSLSNISKEEYDKNMNKLNKLKK